MYLFLKGCWFFFPVFYRDAICFLSGFFSLLLTSLPLFIPPSFFLPYYFPPSSYLMHEHTHTHDQTLRVLWHFFFFLLIPCFSYQMAKPKMPQEQLVLIICEYYKSSHSHCIFTKSPKTWVFFSLATEVSAPLKFTMLSCFILYHLKVG